MAILIVVANAAAARFFSAEPLNANAPLIELEDKVHPSSRLHGRDLETDSPPRVFDSQGHARHAIEPKTDIKEQQADAFALELSNYLEEMRNTNRYDKLYIIASPHFLGLLRGHFKQRVTELLAETVDKDLTHHSVEDIRAHLPDFM
ncbi:Protein required for attachment to host cells [Thiothrix caldifontis]|uniref:Protein required for attachment to host cells n=1 Tax=Thiothrix caldifontis TaxID=525918 RepID=A0A1H4GVD3_9GAMM|nr:host attachment protein [Thiothrix caldifontis]SEB13271.1 Protein required for attachment to host cells [Thiothrix caldifontis]